MQMLAVNEIEERLLFFGRTIKDEDTGAVFFNWSGSGFEIDFEGKRLDAHLHALETVFPPEGTLWPWISVFVEGESVKEVYIDKPSQRYTLFASDVSKRRRIRVVKRTENDKGKAGLAGFEADGKILNPTPPEHKKRLEFIGDSITCGYGNEAGHRDDPFTTQEENGLLAYSAIAADILNADYHSICVSGICLCKPADTDLKLTVPGFPELIVNIRAMEDYYAYTDRLHEEARGKSEFTEWDFSAYRPDAIVVNLGTNDAYRIKAAKDKPREERFFEDRYRAFIEMLRKHNGPLPVICCTLGSMDYYLYDNIKSAAVQYQKDTGDERIFCYKYGGIFPPEEGYGALDHPSVKTNQRMAIELSQALQSWLV